MNINTSSSSSYVTGASSNKGFSGLASGLDTESMVEAMLSGTQNKIDKQNALKQQIEWKQEIYREIITQINDFQSRFFSSTSSTSLLNQSFYNLMSATSASNAFQVTATSSAAVGDLSVAVRQLATNTSLTSGRGVSGKLEASFDAQAFDQLLQAQLGDDAAYTLNLQIGEETVSVNLREVFVDGDTLKNYPDGQDGLDAALQEKLAGALADKGVTAAVENGVVTLSSAGGREIRVGEGSGELALERLGLTASSRSTAEEETGAATLTGQATSLPALEFEVTLDDLTKTVRLDLQEITGADGRLDADKFCAQLQDALDLAHGKDQVQVVGTADGFALQVSAGRKVMVSGGQEAMDLMGLQSGQSNRVAMGGTLDSLYFAEKLQGSSFSFSINGVDFHFTGESTMSDVVSAINRSGAGVRLVYRTQDDTFTLEATDSGTGRQIRLEQTEGNLLNALFGSGADGQLASGSRAASAVLTLEGGGQVTGDTTLGELGLNLTGMGADTKLSEIGNYNPALSFEDGRIVVNAQGEGRTFGDGATMEKLFGTAALDLGTQGGTQAVLAEGQNAILEVDGTLTQRSSNTFSIDGINFTLQGLTGSYAAATGRLVGEDGSELTLTAGQYVEDGVLYSAQGQALQRGIRYETAEGSVEATGFSLDKNGALQQFTGQAASVQVERDTDQIVEGVKQFIDEYNKLIKTLNDYVDEDTSYRDYAPLTDAQRKEMSEREIELWEEKAKEGLLHGDDTIESFLQSMRTALYEKPSGSSYAIYDLGIETGEWETKGQLVLTEDGEAKLRQAIESDAAGVLKLFTDSEEGLAVKLNEIIDRTANLSSGDPGELVQLAGVAGRSSETNNTLYNRLQEIDDKIEALKETYEKEKTRYWNQFNTMEQMIANMSAQSSWLTQMLGGSY